MIWFTSDTHFGHTNIIRHCGRPFKNHEEHDAELIKRWNDQVGERDTVWHLGDFGSFKRHEEWVIPDTLGQLNGRIKIIFGNHDKLVEKYADMFDECFGTHREGAIIPFRDRDFRMIMCHYPIVSWNGSFHGVAHIFGHIHSGPRKVVEPIRNSYDIGVDNNFIKEVGETIQPGHSAIFLLVREAVPDKMIDELKGYNAKVLQTSLSKEQESKLVEIFAADEVVG